MIKAGVIGATGYAGVGLVRILLRHPEVQLTAISSVSFEGKALSEVYPSLREICDLPCGTADEVVEKSDVVFAALPHGLSQETAAACVQAGKKFIDLGADFRLDDPEEYTRWYGCAYTYPELHEQAVYGLPELFRADIVGKAETKRDETLSTLESQKSTLERSIDQLSNFERQYRTRLKSYLNDQLRDLENSTSLAPETLDGNGPLGGSSNHKL